MKYLNIFLLNFIFLGCALFSSPSFGQVEIEMSDSMQRILDRAAKREEKIVKFAITCDSIFFENDFEGLQSFCKMSSEDNDLRQYANINLIANL